MIKLYVSSQPIVRSELEQGACANHCPVMEGTMSSDLLFLAITLVHQIITFILFKLKRSWVRYCILTFLDALVVISFISYYSYRLYQIHHRFPELPPDWSVNLLFIAIYLIVIIKVALDNRKYRKELEQPLNQPSHAAADDDRIGRPRPAYKKTGAARSSA